MKFEEEREAVEPFTQIPFCVLCAFLRQFLFVRRGANFFSGFDHGCRAFDARHCVAGVDDERGAVGELL